MDNLEKALAAVDRFEKDLGFTAPELIPMRIEELRGALRAALAEPEARDTSKSFLPGTQWGLNMARRTGPSAELPDDTRKAVEADLNWMTRRIEAKYGIDVTVIPRPSWETTGLVGSVEDINAVVADLEESEGYPPSYDTTPDD